ncbi:MAG: hypothetical protein E6J43_05265 [Chloroflexi bacterium]|nr:MAG: hypothetical protein E6J43_05265 [Chloroflexota bacterium]
MTITQAGASSWVGLDKRRVEREYDTKQDMVDDIWLAHEHGWLPVAMTESRPGGILGRLKGEKPSYVVAYLRRSP